jgi:ribulose bisphosphate carboxylase small subunit
MDIDNYVLCEGTKPFKLISNKTPKTGSWLCWQRYFHGSKKEYATNALSNLMPARNRVYLTPCNKKVMRVYSREINLQSQDYVLFLK